MAFPAIGSMVEQGEELTSSTVFGNLILMKDEEPISLILLE
jgi:hypothetical protein